MVRWNGKLFHQQMIQVTMLSVFVLKLTVTLNDASTSSGTVFA